MYLERSCPPCKIILDCGAVLPASLNLLAETTEEPKVAAAARYYARIAEGASRALLHGIGSGFISGAKVDEVHAWSELSCHRAKMIREHVAGVGAGMVKNATLLMAWAEQHRLFVTGMIGGEYSGAWVIDGVDGIKKKDEK